MYALTTYDCPRDITFSFYITNNSSYVPHGNCMNTFICYFINLNILIYMIYLFRLPEVDPYGKLIDNAKIDIIYAE